MNTVLQCCRFPHYISFAQCVCVLVFLSLPLSLSGYVSLSHSDDVPLAFFAPRIVFGMFGLWMCNHVFRCKPRSQQIEDMEQYGIVHESNFDMMKQYQSNAGCHTLSEWNPPIPKLGGFFPIFLYGCVFCVQSNPMKVHITSLTLSHSQMSTTENKTTSCHGKW